MQPSELQPARLLCSWDFPGKNTGVGCHFLLQIIKACCCCCLVTKSCLTLWDSMDCSTPGLSVSHHVLKFAQVHVYCIGDAIHPFHPLTPSSPSALNLYQHQGQLAVRIRWPKYWSFSISVRPSNEYSRLISLKIDWFDFLAVQETFRSLLQHHSLKTSILWHSAFLQSSFHNRKWLLGGPQPWQYGLCLQSSLWFSTHCLGLS